MINLKIKIKELKRHKMFYEGSKILKSLGLGGLVHPSLYNKA